MTKEQLENVLTLHAAWLRSEPYGVRANLTGADLYGANLTEANLSRANLTEANLYWANLTGADLYGANLTEANLTGAILYETNLTEANLTGANLTGANFTGANLTGANITRASLNGANLYILQGYFGKHHCYSTPQIIRIGCHEKTHDQWLNQYKEIGKKEGYTDFEIKMYGAFIKKTIAWANQLPKEKK